MKSIVNPITEEGKVKCLHYYELCLKGKWYESFIAIFTFKEKVYLYKTDRENNKKLIFDFGDITPYHMTIAVEYFRTLIK